MKTSKKSGQHCTPVDRKTRARTKVTAAPVGTLGILGITPPGAPTPLGNGQFRTKNGELIEISGYTKSEVRRVKAKAGKNVVHLDLKLAADSKRAVTRALGEGGIVLVQKADQDAAFDLILNLRYFPTLHTASHPGWSGQSFVFIDGSVVHPPEVRPPEIDFAGDPDRCAQGGLLSTWTTQVADPLARHPIPAFVILTAFAPFVLPLTGRVDNFSFEIIGKGGTGKSTIQLLAASALGPIVDGGDGQYWTTFDTTKAGTQTVLETYSGHTIYMDEATLAGDGNGAKARALHLLHFAFQVASGKGRTIKGKLAKGMQRCVAVVSSNDGLANLAGYDGSRELGPALDRLIPLRIDKDRPFGVFERLPSGGESLKEFAQSLTRIASENHGRAGRRFIRHLVSLRAKDEEGLRQRIALRLRQFRKLVGASEDNGSACRVADAFGIVMVSGELAQEFDILSARYNCQKIAKYVYKMSQTQRGTSTAASDILRLLEHSSTINLDPDRLPTLSDGEMERSVAFVHRPKNRRAQLLVWPAALKRQFPDWAAMLRAPDVASTLMMEGERPTSKRLVRANKPGKDRMYCFELPYGTI